MPGTHGTDGTPQRRLLPRVPGWALTLAILLGVALAALAPLGHLLTGGGISAIELLYDPVEMADIAWYLGGVASLNMFVWAGAVALFLVGAVGLWRSEQRLALALGLLGLLTVAITLDDRFLLHELVLPHFGIPEIVTYAAYALAALVLVTVFARVLLAQPEAWLLAAALAGMAASVLLDIWGLDSDVRRVAEEFAKMVGATCLLFVPASILVRRLRRPV